MRRIITPLAAWLVAGIAALSLATAAVSVVGNQVTGNRPAPLSADEVRAELAGGEGTTTAPEPSAGTTTRPGSTDGPGPTVTGSTTTTTTASPSTPTTTPPAAPAPVTRTYSLEGGTATLRFSADGVRVVVASPAAGFSVEVEPTHDSGVRVEFRSDSHRSRIDAWWDEGPRDEVREED